MIKNVIRSIILICFLFVNIKVMASDTANNKKILIAYDMYPLYWTKQ